jgi:bacteriorhodopsin
MRIMGETARYFVRSLRYFVLPMIIIGFAAAGMSVGDTLRLIFFTCSFFGVVVQVTLAVCRLRKAKFEAVVGHAITCEGRVRLKV